MSQIWIPTTAGNLPPSVPTSFVTDSGTAVPAANVLDVFGGTTTANNTNGVMTTGGTNIVTVKLTNRAYGTVTTTDATLTTIITFGLGAVAGLYTIRGNIGGFIPASNAGGSYDFIASVRTSGVAATQIGTNYDTNLEDVVMSPSDIHVNVSGNNVLIQVQGLALTTIDWVAEFNYIVVT